MNPRADLNEPEKRKIFFPCAGIRMQIFQSVTQWLVWARTWVFDC